MWGRKLLPSRKKTAENLSKTLFSRGKPKRDADNMFFDHPYPPISFEGETLNLYSSRIDVIVPILDLEGDAENFILDLHYSLNNQRSRPAGAIVSICDDLLTGIEKNRALILSELAERIPQWSAVEILDAWEADIQRMMSVASNSAPDHPVSWIRRSDG